MSGDDSWSAKAGVAGKVFVIALTSTVFQQTMMWSFGSAFSVLRRTIADAQRGRIESKASDAKDRAARRRIEHKVRAADPAAPMPSRPLIPAGFPTPQPLGGRTHAAPR